VKSSIAYVKREGFGEFTSPPVKTYTITYRVSVNLKEETVRIIDIIQKSEGPNQPEVATP